MTDRHERRRAKKILTGVQRVMSSDQIAETACGCAWIDCTASAKVPSANGWSSLILYKGEPKTEFMEIAPEKMPRDCVLCPEHARYLDEKLLKFNGSVFRCIAGTA